MALHCGQAPASADMASAGAGVLARTSDGALGLEVRKEGMGGRLLGMEGGITGRIKPSQL